MATAASGPEASTRIDVPIEAASIISPMIEVVAGLNLPMLVKLARVRRDCNLHKAAAAAQDAGRKYINIASQVLGD